MTPAEVLTKAADLIEERGWTQGEFLAPDGCLCAWGAILVAVGAEPHHGAEDHYLVNSNYGAADPALAVLAAHVGVGERDTPLWNDEPGRTKDEVVTALRAAAEVAS